MQLHGHLHDSSSGSPGHHDKWFSQIEALIWPVTVHCSPHSLTFWLPPVSLCSVVDLPFFWSFNQALLFPS